VLIVEAPCPPLWKQRFSSLFAQRPGS
jgi:hypothetical protein